MEVEEGGMEKERRDRNGKDARKRGGMGEIDRQRAGGEGGCPPGREDTSASLLSGSSRDSDPHAAEATS